MMFSSTCSQVCASELAELSELEELDSSCPPCAGDSVDSPDSLDSLDPSQMTLGQHFPLVQVNPVLQGQSAWKQIKHTSELVTCRVR